ncbi:META domain-containing protein [Dysgonomonas sp. 520]|uniref:META domain-containing protein n=1 Tax=Dysgonomonas sp. 520 TaxID=2302931 RepID=UPI0013D441DC|nr:META domain-containing protein [Dysgonomonas sp. 520]NDW10284.1 META domain-containing protein [Dysgonomonas sp. 520]
MKRLINLSLAMAVIISLGMTTQGCKSTKDTLGGVSAINGTWVLATLDGEDVADIFEGKVPTMNVDASAKQIFGNGGCNSYTGAFTYEKGVFSAPRVAATMMMCFAKNKESAFFAMLAKPNTISVENGVLTFKNSGSVVATFIRGVDQNVFTQEWKLESINGESSDKLFTEETLPTLKFNVEEKRVNGSAGCNTFNGTYSVASEYITVGPLMTTRRACPNMEGEYKYTQALTGVSKVSMTKNGTLTLTRDGKNILTYIKK